MLELSVPIFDTKGSTTKDHIVQVLLEERELTMLEIHKRIRKQFNITLTYQGTRKAIEKLVQQGVVKKDNKLYALDESWLFQLKSFADDALKKKSQQITRQFRAKQVQEDFTSFTLTSLFELDNFWGDLLLHLAKNAKKKLSVNIGHDAWWILVNLGRETHLYSEYKRLGIETYFILLNDNQLNRRAQSVYEEIGIPTTVVDKHLVNECIGIDSVGDVIVEVKYPQNIVKKIKAYVKKHSDGKFDITEITRLAHTPCTITLNVYKNPELAEAFNEKYWKYVKSETL